MLKKIQNGIPAAIFSALLFGCGTPLLKLMVNDISPVLLAGIIYFFSGLILFLFFLIGRKRKKSDEGIHLKDLGSFSGSILFGGILGPVLLMTGLLTIGGSSASLLLNLEGVFTALIAWFVFKENFDKKIVIGMALILLGGVLLSIENSVLIGSFIGILSIMGACLCWAIDNNLTQKLSTQNLFLISSIKGLVAGTVNIMIAFIIGQTIDNFNLIIPTITIGFFSYGISLVLFVYSLRHIGTARTSAYFSSAPFFGAILSILIFNEPITLSILSAGLLMIIGIYFHISENHGHEHIHEFIQHSHSHNHIDEHHFHNHVQRISTDETHTHTHIHEPFTHQHAHFPDIHHRHGH